MASADRSHTRNDCVTRCGRSSRLNPGGDRGFNSALHTGAITKVRRDSETRAVIDPVTDLVGNLALLTAHRADLVADRVRMINRLRDVMTSVFPSLEREFDYAHCTAKVRWCCSPATPAQTPIRRIGETRLAAWLGTTAHPMLLLSSAGRSG